MAENHHRRNDCRLCQSVDVERVIQLTPTPPANAFVGPECLEAPQEIFPLDVYFCNICHHVQLLDIVDPKILFENYVYVSGTSPVFIRHFKDYADEVLSRHQIGPGSLVLDVGSNDGTLLRHFQNAGCSVLGIDPAEAIAAAATNDGIETLNAFFDRDIAVQIKREFGAAKVITANNVLAHADNLSEIINAVTELLSDDGVLVFEVSYLGDVVSKILFDTIYHEHLAYHSVGPLDRFLTTHGMTLTHVTGVDAHGGSIRAYAQKTKSSPEINESVRTFIESEKRLGLDHADTFRGFGQRIDSVKVALNALFDDIARSGKTIAGFGAPAKATTLIYHFGLGDRVKFIVDDNELKQGLYSPGLHIPVLPSSAIYERMPDYLILLAWNFADSIIQNHLRYQDIGGSFILPLPEPKIISK